VIYLWFDRLAHRKRTVPAMDPNLAPEMGD
jgi:hypothetical protein